MLQILRRLGLGPRRRFTHVVPLGLSCRVTAQLRSYFRQGESYPFDWWLSPLEGLTRYLWALDPARIYAPDALEELLVDGEVGAIRSKEFGLRLFHEFPRHLVNGVSAVSPGWQARIASAREQHMRRLARLRDLNRRGNRILFLRHKYDFDPDRRAPSVAAADLLTVLRAQWGAAQTELLLINFPIAGEPPGGVLTLDFDDPPGPHPDTWRGETERWFAAFDSLRLRHPGAAQPGPGHLSGPSE